MQLWETNGTKGNFQIDGTEKDNLTEIMHRSWFTGRVYTMYDDTECVNVPLKSASLRSGAAMSLKDRTYHRLF